MTTDQPDTTLHRITRLVRERATRYYPHLAGQAVQVRVAHTRMRQFAQLCELQLSSRDAKHVLLAKIKRNDDEARPESRLVESYVVPRPDRKGAEYAAMATIQAHFDRLADPRFFAVSVLDSLLDDQVLLLEKMPVRSLSRVLSSCTNPVSRFMPQRMLGAVERAGAWLRHFHQMPCDVASIRRGTHQTDFLAWIQTVGTFLNQQTRGRQFFQRIQGPMIRAAHEVLPEELPCSALHDDFAPRNVLLDNHGRVGVIDTLMEWHGCVWEDVAQFVVSVHTNKLQALSGGVLFSQHFLNSIEEALVSAYFGSDPIPWRALRLYQAQIALTKWAAMVQGLQQKRRSRNSARLAISTRQFARYIEDRLRRMEHAAIDPRARVIPPNGGRQMPQAFDEAALREHVKLHARDYFAELGGDQVAIELTKTRKRRFSLTFQYALRSDTVIRQLFVKVPIESASLNAAATSLDDRPRLVPVLPVLEEVRLEHAGLTRMEQHFSQQNDPRIGVPRVLDLIGESAIVVECIERPTLDEMLKRDHSLMGRRREDDLQQAFYNTGVWLRAFHELPAGPQSQARLDRRDRLQEAITGYMSYLSSQPYSGQHVASIRRSILRHVGIQIPPTLRLVCGHGDFGLHNVFVMEDLRVIGFDTLACWQTSPYEDISYFLLLLETVPPTFISRSWFLRAETVGAARHAFLEGYFGKGDVPYGLIRVFDVLVSLDKWASAVHSSRRASGLRGAAKNYRLKLQQNRLLSRIKRALHDLDSHSLGIGASP